MLEKFSMCTYRMVSLKYCLIDHWMPHFYTKSCLTAEAALNVPSKSRLSYSSLALASSLDQSICKNRLCTTMEKRLEGFLFGGVELDLSMQKSRGRLSENSGWEIMVNCLKTLNYTEIMQGVFKSSHEFVVFQVQNEFVVCMMNGLNNSTTKRG